LTSQRRPRLDFFEWLARQESKVGAGRRGFWRWVGHNPQMVLLNKHAENNAGIFLVLELAMPVLIFG
jgi:hypothetical protein